MARLSKVGGDKSRVVDELQADGFLVTEWSDAADSSYEPHVHGRREVRVVLAGELTIVAGSNTFVLRPGNRLDLAPGEVHSARVGPAGVTYLAGSAR
jgi:quercetin dioxygenase-like cupin family protein